MILQQLKETWGCCFHEIARGYYFHYWINIEGFTTKNVSHNYWHLCGIQPPEKCHYDIADIIPLIQLSVQPGSKKGILLANTNVNLFLNSSAKLNPVLTCITMPQLYVPI
jgi:hypothetical protein